MNTKNIKQDNPNVYPSNEIDWRETGIQNKTVYENQNFGISLRDKFAGQAMQGIMVGDSPCSHHPEQVAEWAYKTADAMLKYREL